MNGKKTNNNETPVRPKGGRRSLGLRKTIMKPQIQRTPINSTEKANAVNKYLEDENLQLESPKTPVTNLKSFKLDSDSDKICSSSSASSRNSYKLSLSKTFKEKYRKKRLSFSSFTGSESEWKENSNKFSPLRNLPQSPKQISDSIEHLTPPKNITLQDKSLESLENGQKYKNTIIELKNMIEIWKKGFQSAFKDLKEKTGIQNNELLLHQLGLPREIIRLCEE